MSADLDCMVAENSIDRARPASGPVASLCLLIAGLIVAVMSTPLLLTGFFARGPMLILGWVGVGVSLIYFLLAWGLHGGHLWAWCGSLVLSLPTMLLAVWIFPAFPGLSTTLLAVLLGVQLMLWRRGFRGWILRAHGLRSGVLPEPR
jgi:hypothetical protein